MKVPRTATQRMPITSILGIKIHENKLSHPMKNSLRNFSCNEKFLAPSLLAADFANLGQEVCGVDLAGADILHFDIMDGHFVPNLSIGPAVVKAVRPLTKLPFDVHLMLSKPGDYINQFSEAGADHITIHVEAEDDIETTLAKIRFLGCSVGISIKPGTSAESIIPYLEIVDLILVMTVEPGFGGQKFLGHVVEKIKTIRKWIEKNNHPIHLEVDGGINVDTAPIAVGSGINILVAGSSIFQSTHGVDSAIQSLKQAYNGGS